MRKWIMVGLIVLTALVSTLIARSFQSPAIRAVDEAILREYAGTYQWDRNAFVYLQIWPELTGTNQLVAFDETGELRILYPTEPDRFFTGPGAAIPTPVESRIEVQRADSGKIASLTWSREGAPARTARRVDIERREDVRFSNGDVQLAGTLITSHHSGTPSCRDSRSRVGRGRSRVPAPVRPLSHPPRHGCSRVRQARCWRLDG